MQVSSAVLLDSGQQQPQQQLPPVAHQRAQSISYNSNNNVATNNVGQLMQQQAAAVTEKQQLQRQIAASIPATEAPPPPPRTLSDTQSQQQAALTLAAAVRHANFATKLDGCENDNNGACANNSEQCVPPPPHQTNRNILLTGASSNNNDNSCTNSCSANFKVKLTKNDNSPPNNSNNSNQNKPTCAGAAAAAAVAASKYSKVYTKKAWIKNYDLEEQNQRQVKSEQEPFGSTATTTATATTTTTTTITTTTTTTTTAPAQQQLAVSATERLTLSDDNSADKDIKQKTTTNRRIKSEHETDVGADDLRNFLSPDNSQHALDNTQSNGKSHDNQQQIASANNKKHQSKSKQHSDNMLKRKSVQKDDKVDYDEQQRLARRMPTRNQANASAGAQKSSKNKASKKTNNNSPATATTQKQAKILSKKKTSVTSSSDKRKRQPPEKQAKAASVDSYKRTGKNWLQQTPCRDVVSQLYSCLECKPVSEENEATESAQWDHFCRFYDFRKLKYNEKAEIVPAGFLQLHEASENDTHLWKEGKNNNLDLELSSAEYILKCVGDEFCTIVRQDQAACSLYERINNDKGPVVWKRPVPGVREMCDTCSTTVFNCHFVCESCGFVVCIDCYSYRAHFSHLEQQSSGNKNIEEKNNVKLSLEGDQRNNHKYTYNDTSKANYQTQQQRTATTNKRQCDSFGWIRCAKGCDHTLDKLTLAKIITKDCLENLSAAMHKERSKLSIECICTRRSELSLNFDYYPFKLHNSNLSLLPAFVGNNSATATTTTTKSIVDDHQQSEGCGSGLRDLLLDKTTSPQVVPSNSDANNNSKKQSQDDESTEEEDDSKLSSQVAAAIDDCITALQAEEEDRRQDEDTTDKDEDDDDDEDEVEDNYSDSDSDVDWLCDNELLVLERQVNENQLRLFREQWFRGCPILVRGVQRRLQLPMWSPNYFVKQFSENRHDLVDCRNGRVCLNQSMKRYWEGFENNDRTSNSNGNSSSVCKQAKRLKRSNDNSSGEASGEEVSTAPSYFTGSALWKLKDWPPTEDFYKLLPAHYDDYMNNLPLKLYTYCSGQLNLAARLPILTLKPDLGPKMYSAYGSTAFPERGTTNLHLDVSDAVNVMMYVANWDDTELAAKTVAEASIDDKMKLRIKEQNLVPGALWHVFKTSDTDKLRAFLNQVARERNVERTNAGQDPIHDQIWYLDEPLLERLRCERGVKPFAILQCMGDAILIPAGAPHQVKNLRSCVKVANDFVSPENVGHCLKLTNEFRCLSEAHMNHEDKLQIKNILYHTVKDCVQALSTLTTK